MTRRSLLTRVGIAITAIAGWFLAVDCSHFCDECPNCLSDRAIRQYRIATIPVYERTKSDTSLIQAMAIDLGVPCTHPHMQRTHLHRFWGLMFCYRPCINGIRGLSSKLDTYEIEMRPKVIAYKQSHPEISEHFRQRVLVEHDLKYWKVLWKTIEASEISD